MRRREIVLSFLGGLFALAVGLYWHLPLAQAQCEDVAQRSSCITCHAEMAPLSAEDIWHGIHAAKDCCASCHGGNCSMLDEKLAHEGVSADPLEDIYTSCHACHPDDYTQRAAVFAAVLGVTPGSRATPTPFPIVSRTDYQMVIPDVGVPITQASFTWGWLTGGLLILAILGLLFRQVYLRVRHDGMNHG